MRIFFSHSSRDKPLLREIRRCLPSHLAIWIDEMEIPVGNDLSKTIKKAIQSRNDLIVFFFGPEAIKSEWVRKELQWAIGRERVLKRVFIVPVVLDTNCWSDLPADFQERKYLLCTDFTEAGVKHFAGRLYNEIFYHFLLLVDGSPDSLIVSRKKEVYGLATLISEDQTHPSKEQKLTKTKLKRIISLIDPKNKVLLLLLYELVLGKFAAEMKANDLDRANIITFEFQVARLGTWIHTFDWSSQSNSFRALTFEYGLGDSRYLVKDVFLKSISSLSKQEKHEIFNKMRIVSFSLDKWREV